MAAVGGSRLTIGENMIMTYDWMVYAQNHPDFKKEIEETVLCENTEWLLSEEAFSIYASCMYHPTYEEYKAQMED